MNKKGFTLAELLGVIVLLGVISVIAITTIDSKIKEGRKKTCEAQQKNIEEAAKAWAIDNPDEDDYELKISDLQSQGYLDSDFKNPMTDKNYEDESKVVIIYDEVNTKYTVTFNPTSNDACK